MRFLDLKASLMLGAELRSKDLVLVDRLSDLKRGL